MTMTEDSKDGVGFAIGMAGLLAGSFLSAAMFDINAGFWQIAASLVLVVLVWWSPMYAYYRWRKRAQ